MLTFENASCRRLRNVMRLKHNAIKVGDSETMFPLRRLISKSLRLSLQKRTNQNFIKNRFCLNLFITLKNFNRFFEFLFFSRDFTMYVSRAVARTLIEGVYIHIFRFCPTSFF